LFITIIMHIPHGMSNFAVAGPGAFDFTQGDTNGTTFWRLVRDFLSDPTAEQIACHAPKPILLNTGARPFNATPAAVSTWSSCRPRLLLQLICLMS